MWWLPSWRRVRFTATLPSDLPGVDFVATITARWRKTRGTPARVVAPAIRVHLRSAAAAVTQTHPTRDPDAARDAVLRDFAVSTVDYAGALIQVHASIRLRVAPQGRRLAEQRTARARDLQLRQEAERNRLVFLRQEVFADPALARIWWLQQRPQLITAAGEDILVKTMEESASAAASRPTQDRLLPILTELVAWLARDEPSRRYALYVLDKLLDIVPPPDELRDRLRQLPEFQPWVPPASGKAVEDRTNLFSARSRKASSDREGYAGDRGDDPVVPGRG
jgi:hypothetical protein